MSVLNYHNSNISNSNINSYHYDNTINSSSENHDNNRRTEEQRRLLLDLCYDGKTSDGMDLPSKTYHINLCVAHVALVFHVHSISVFMFVHVFTVEYFCRDCIRY